METTNNIQLLEAVPESALSLITKAEIDVQISTAKAFPRSITQFIQKATSLATVNENIAASCTYALPRGGKSLEGPSVRLAEIVCSSFGNIRSGARVIANDGKTITAQGICHDLETNNYISVEVKRKITDKNGKPFNEDMQVMAGNAACAIALRNAVYKVVPMALVQEIWEQAKLVAKGTAATLVERRNKAVNYFLEMKVTEKQICDVLEIKKIEDIDLDKLQTLSGFRSAIKNGEATIEGIFNSVESIDPDDLQFLFEQKKDSLDAATKANIERILKNKETASYKKVQSLLNA